MEFEQPKGVVPKHYGVSKRAALRVHVSRVLPCAYVLRINSFSPLISSQNSL